MIKDALQDATVRLAMFAHGTPLEKYLEPATEEEDLNWTSYETVTAPFASEISANLQDKRVPVLHKILAGLGLEIDSTR